VPKGLLIRHRFPIRLGFQSRRTPPCDESDTNQSRAK
jgi:hypothetical protein